MSQITLVRHGQAQTAARDDAGYDSLSPLGRQQAAWLGAHLSETREPVMRLYCGTLRRHEETAQAMNLCPDAEVLRDARLNEISYFTLAGLLEQQHGIAIPDNRESFVGHLPRLMEAWHAGQIDDAPETFEEFEHRTRDVLADIAAGEGPALAVTSGGLIGMAVRQVLGLDLAGMSRMCLAILNTSLHHLHPIGDRLGLTQFNAVPHLDPRERQFALTHL